MKNKRQLSAQNAAVFFALAFCAMLLTACNVGIFDRWPSFTVDFNANGGSGATDSLTVNMGSYVTIPGGGRFSRTGYSFAGWNTNADGTGAVFNAGTELTPTGHLTLYAMWALPFIVTFDANGGEGTPPAPRTAPAGTTITIPGGEGLFRAGYAFARWNSNADGTGTTFNVGDTFTPTSHLTLYAMWIYMITFTVTFDANGGDGTPPASQTIPAGTYITIPDARGLFRTGYFFAGWSTSAHGAGTVFNIGNTFTPTGSTTLFAIWVYTVPGTTFGEQLSWLQTNARSGGEYLMGIFGIEDIAPQSLFFYGRNNITITLRGIDPLRINSLYATGGNLLFIGSGVTLMLDNIRLNRRAGTGSLVRIGNGGTLVVNTEAEIIRGSAGSGNFGGGVRIENGGTLIMNGGEVSGNTGGGIFVESGGMFVMNSGKVSGNSALGTTHGGGIRVAGGGTFVMNDGEISGNSAAQGGGIVVLVDGRFDMRSGRIFDNRATITGTQQGGGGIRVDTGGTFRMSNGTIYGLGASAGLPNIGSNRALFGVGQHGTFDTTGAFTSLGSLGNTNNTIRIVNGVRQ